MKAIHFLFLLIVEIFIMSANSNDNNNNNKKRKLPASINDEDNNESNAEPLCKKQRIADAKQTDPIITKAVKTIGTHHGQFHCDEVFACYMLSNHTKEFRNANIIRSRDPKVLSAADIIVDVGAEYDRTANKFDHHQSSFFETFSPQFETKLSSAGLIYKYFGKEIIKDILINHKDDIKTDMDNDLPKDNAITDGIIDILYIKVYKSLIEGIDGIDNGINQYDTDKEQRYRIGTDLSSRVGNFNPWWNQPHSDEIEMTQFRKAMEVVGQTLIQEVLYKYKAWLPAREIVERALRDRFKVHSSGKIMKLDQYCPWVEHFFEIQEETPIEPMPLYVLFADTRGGWRIRAMPVALGSFENVKPLPAPWRGVRNEELDRLCDLRGCVFVHASGFIGGHQTFEGALRMAELAVEFKCDDAT